MKDILISFLIPSGLWKEQIVIKDNGGYFILRSQPQYNYS